MTLCQFSIFHHFTSFLLIHHNTPDTLDMLLIPSASNICAALLLIKVDALMSRLKFRERGNPDRLRARCKYWYIFWICSIILIPFGTMCTILYHHVDGYDDGTFFATGSLTCLNDWHVSKRPPHEFKAIWRVVQGMSVISSLCSLNF